MPRYAPPFLKSATFGYMLSALAGTGLIILAVCLTAGWLLRRRIGMRAELHRAHSGQPDGRCRICRPRGADGGAGRRPAAHRSARESRRIVRPGDRRCGVASSCGDRPDFRRRGGAGDAVADSDGCRSRWIWAPVLFFTGTIAMPAIFLTPGPAVFAFLAVAITARACAARPF